MNGRATSSDIAYLAGVMEVDAASRRFAALCGRCAPSPAAPGSYPLALAPLDFVVCAAGAAP